MGIKPIAGTFKKSSNGTMNSNFEWAFFGGKPEGIKTLCAVTDAVGVPAFVTPPKDLPKADIDELSDAASALGCPVLSQEAAFNSSQNLTIGLCQRYDIIPAEQIQLPRLGFLNLHPSLLPKYRGVHPVSWAIINGETEAGATLHVIDAKVDTGPIVLQGSTPIDIHDDIWSVTHRCAEIATELAVTGMSDICHRGELPPVRAQIGLPSYAPRRTPKDSIFMPHTVTARQVFDLVRALRPPLPPAQIDLCNGFVEPVYHCSIEPVEGWRRLPVLDGYVWVETGPKSMS